MRKSTEKPNLEWYHIWLLVDWDVLQRKLLQRNCGKKLKRKNEFLTSYVWCNIDSLIVYIKKFETVYHL